MGPNYYAFYDLRKAENINSDPYWLKVNHFRESIDDDRNEFKDFRIFVAENE